MRLFLLPISTRRALIYCHKIQKDTNVKPSLVDRATTKANETWASWEQAEGGWKKSVTGWGNVLLRRIPFEEWGLKTIPALSAKKKELEISQQDKIEVLFPGRYLEAQKVPDLLERLATERQTLHKTKMTWSLIGAPLTLPFALIPIIPNFPGFYLVFRAYSHWKALRGGQHLEWLTKNKLTAPKPSTILDELYTAGLMHPSRQASRAALSPSPQECDEIANTIRAQSDNEHNEVMLLKRWNGKLLAEQFKLPEMEVEIERAVEQVEASIAANDGPQKDKLGPEKAAEQSSEKIFEKDTR